MRVYGYILLMLGLSGSLTSTSIAVNLCDKGSGNYGLRNGDVQFEFKECDSNINALLLRTINASCKGSRLTIKEFQIEKDICQHGTGRCFIFSRGKAVGNLLDKLPTDECSHLHWKHDMPEPSVTLEWKPNTNSKFPVISYHFVKSNETKDAQEKPQCNSKSMTILMMVLVIAVSVLSFALIISIARLCYISLKYNGLERISKEGSSDEREALTYPETTHNTNLVPNAQNNSQSQVIPNRLYQHHTHLYEEATF